MSDFFLCNRLVWLADVNTLDAVAEKLSYGCIVEIVKVSGHYDWFSKYLKSKLVGPFWYMHLGQTFAAWNTQFKLRPQLACLTPVTTEIRFAQHIYCEDYYD